MHLNQYKHLNQKACATSTRIEVVEVPAAQPEQLLTASVALLSSVRNQGTGFCIKCY